MKEDLFVSAIIPVHNGERFLAGAIENILNQNYHPLEIIVVDDGSTDRTPEIAAQFQEKFQDIIRYIYQPNSGPAAARNQGIKIAQGNVIAFLDVDDLWSENKLALQIAYLAAHPEIQIVQGLIQQMELDSSSLNNEELIFKISSIPYQFINIGSAIYRQSVFEKVGLYDEKFIDNEDTDWFFRAWMNNISKVVLNEVTLFYRKHNRNMTLQQTNLVYFGLLKVYKKMMNTFRQQSNFPGEKLGRTSNFFEYIGKPPKKM